MRVRPPLESQGGKHQGSATWAQAMLGVGVFCPLIVGGCMFPEFNLS